MKYLHWRNQSVRFHQIKEVNPEWEAEIPRIYEKIKNDRKSLFEELDFYCQETLLGEKSPLPNLDI
jgi:hypothetical protein